MHHAREGNRLTQMRQPADPRHGSLQSEAKAGVYERAVLPEIEVPRVGLDRQSFLLNPMQQPVVVVLALRSADDLAVALGGEQIVAENRPRVLRILLHVESLRFLWIVVDEDRTVLSFDKQ